MDSSRFKAVAVFVGISIALALPGGVLADDAPSARIHSAVQQGEGVELTLWFCGKGDPGLGDPTTLVRYGPEGEHFVFEDRSFSAQEAAWTDSDEWDTYYHFVVLDECVPPGATTYKFPYGSWEVDSEDIEVEDLGQVCPDPSGGDDSGCSVSGVGAGAPLGALALFMLGIGLAAGRLGRSENR